MTGNSGSTSNYEGSTIHFHQGLAINFNPSATVNDVSMCVYKYEGCTDSTMINYNSHATVDDGSCFPIVVGCLDRSAENFNCTFPGVNDGSDAKRVLLQCDTFAAGGRGVTVHADAACAEFKPPPPSPPPPAIAGPTENFFSATLTVTGDLTTYDTDAFKTSTAAQFDTLVGVTGGVVTVAAGSVVVTYSISGLSDAQRDTAIANADQHLASSTAASAYFGVPVESVSYEVIEYSLSPPSAPDNEAERIGIIVGAVLGCLVGLGLILLVTCMLKRKKKGNVAPS